MLERGALASAIIALTLDSATDEASARPFFNRIASFPVTANLPRGAGTEEETAAEIVAASADGRTLVYTDGPQRALGLIDIGAPSRPKARGLIPLDARPTSVATIGNIAYAALDATRDAREPDGALIAVDLSSKAKRGRCALGGQPDAVAAAKDGSFLAVAIENQRDGDGDGAIPQLPAGWLAILPIKADGAPDCAAMRRVALIGLADIASADPEPEFVDVSENGEILITLQENNHVAVISAHGAVLSHFSAGTVDLREMDMSSDGALIFGSHQPATPREPDGARWLPGGRIVTANEGDYDGGGRGFTIFSRSGRVLYDSGPSFEHWMARIGHFPDARASKRGGEPENVETATFGRDTYIFVAAERASAIAVYRDAGPGAPPQQLQVLPTGVAPEGLLAMPQQKLLIAASEADLGARNGPGGPRSYVTIYQLQDAPPRYPHLVSDLDAEGRPIGWGALSGLTADPQIPGKLYAVCDGFYRAQPAIFEIDAARAPARITRRILVTKGGAPAPGLDLEGIASDGAGGFWLVSEGQPEAPPRAHRLLHVDAAGVVRHEIPFPATLLRHQTKFGAEGVARQGEALWVALQREWTDDAEGRVKLLRVDLRADALGRVEEAWSVVHYPLDKTRIGWVGVSEITIHGGYAYILERDNQVGETARVKRLYRVALSELEKRVPLGATPPVVKKTLVRDFLPDMAATGGFALEKIEGFAVDVRGIGYVVTDNDGVDNSNGETLFLSIGRLPSGDVAAPNR